MIFLFVTISETPSIIAISETRLNENSQLNISIPGSINQLINQKLIPTKARIPKQIQVDWDFIFLNI